MVTEFDITGFVHFPRPFLRNIKRLDVGRTYVYLAAFDNQEGFSNINLSVSGEYSGDNLSNTRNVDTSKLSVNEVVNLMKNSTNDPDFNSNMLSCVLIGWSNFTYKKEIDIRPWVCGFQDLTEEGQKLYYSFKKLHNSKEVRLLTFDTI